MKLIYFRNALFKVYSQTSRRHILSFKCDFCAQRVSVPLRPKKPKAEGHEVQSFVDWRRVQAFGGRGGNGANSFLQIWCNPFAGPDGGDGGNGGHVIFEATKRVKSLQHVEALLKGAHGEKGQSKDCFGKSAVHTFVEVPLGTAVKTPDGRSLADLCAEGDMFLAARGGAGGKGNHYFLSNTNRAPRVSELGAEGEQQAYLLELKTIAHAGLIGFPNAGKSTLLRAISRARPKVASYPFTTLKPHIGIVQYDDYEQISVADIPGLIEDAHLNRGLGVSFLKHVERCLCFLYVIDLSQETPWLQMDVLRREIDCYRPGLTDKITMIVGNKIDLPEAQENLPLFESRVGMPVIPVSAKTGVNLEALLRLLREMYDEGKLSEKFPS